MTQCDFNRVINVEENANGDLRIYLRPAAKRCKESLKIQLKNDLLSHNLDEIIGMYFGITDPSFEPILGEIDGDKKWTAKGKDYIKEVLYHNEFTFERI